MKKCIAIFLTIFLAFSIVPINASAFSENSYGGIDVSLYQNSELDLSQYTPEDILQMTNEEYLTLIRDFERVYDPYDSYVPAENNQLNYSNELAGNGNVSPTWTSGDLENGEWVEAGSHELITAYACTILSNDKGFYTKDATAVVVILLSISLASMMPDKDEDGSLPFKFVGHFYDPETEKNYLRQTSNTAKTNAIAHYNAAISAANSGDMVTAYEKIGRCLHYIQDANVPHHAANIHALHIPYGASHLEFEGVAFSRIDRHLASFTSIASSHYSRALSMEVSNITREGALSAKNSIDYVKDVHNIDNQEWDRVIKNSLQRAAMYSAMVLYKFGKANFVPFFE
ncbi:MAG: hypothetical protein ACI4I0_07785 [Acutalibacteraceae bacterium]